MQTIGERLEEARKRKGISVREAAETTKIRGDYLQKFEANSLDIDLPPLYLRGFIRTYAKFLDLDAERLLGDVDAALAREGKPQRREHREALGRVDFGGETRAPESNEPAANSSRSAREKAMMIKLGLMGGGALVAIVVIILLINVIFFRSPAKTAPQNNVPAATQPAGPRCVTRQRVRVWIWAPRSRASMATSTTRRASSTQPSEYTKARDRCGCRQRPSGSRWRSTVAVPGSKSRRARWS